jgi:outer membrane protein assembly factor BamE (lipoprotein component of BamABCDE complex)
LNFKKNMLRYVWFGITLIAVLESSCGKSLPVLDGIDRQAWKDDKNACAEKRTEMIDRITAQKEKLLGLTEVELVELLGKPDRNELYKRNQKFYYYFVQPSEKCIDQLKNKHPAQLVVRFNAVGLAKEVSVDK